METPGKQASTPHRSGGSVFATTRWAVVMAARDGDTTAAAEPFEELCRAYWAPIYAYIRRDGYGIEDAQDLTQEFFARWLEKRWLRHLEDQRGRFRSFLLTFLKHFLSDHRDRVSALKRGGGRQFIALDQFEAEERERIEPVDALTPDQVFDRRWLQRLNERAVERLRREYESAGKLDLFELFKEVRRGGSPDETQAEMGRRLGVSTSAVKSALHRFHRRQSELLLEEVAHTVGRADAVTDELRELLAALGA